MAEETDQFESIAERLIKRRIDVERDLHSEDLPHWVEDNWQPKGELIVTEEIKPGEEGIEGEVELKVDKSLKAKKFLELVENGEQPNRAARLLDTTVRDMTQNEELRYILKDLVEKGTYPAVLRKAFYRAGIDEIFLKNVRLPKGHKTALAAAKLAISDPEIALNAPPVVGVGVSIDMGELGKLLVDLKPIPGLESFLEGDMEPDGED